MTAPDRLHNSPELLREFIDYDPETGTLTWKPRDRRHFETNRGWAIWNGRYAGKPALNCDDKRGYRMGRVLRSPVFAHRAAWAITYGEWPNGIIDHINGDGTDNRIQNLRVVDDRQNSRNAAMHSRNKTGRVGVHWDKRHSYYVAYINDERGRKHLGSFGRIEDAIAARAAAAIANGYHENHGRMK